MELNDIQKEIVETTERKVVVIASAASGKTTVLVERLKYLLNKGVDPSKIVCITFTNAAAEELKHRFNYPSNLFIGTVHSYCNRLLLMSGYDTSQIIKDKEFDELFEAIKGRPQAIKEVEYLLLDESQDSTANELYFMIDMIQPTNYMLVGDYRQSIYGFRDAYPEYIMDLKEEYDVTTYDLDKNYRNGSTILSFAKKIIAKNGRQFTDYSIPMNGITGKVIEVELSYEKIAHTIKEFGNYNDWFILCRTNQEIEDICYVLEKNEIPFDTFKRAQLDTDEFNQIMEKDSVKVLTIHTSKGLERKNVVVIGAKFFNKEETQVSYVAATRAKELLVWTQPARKKKKTTDMMNWG